GIGTAGPRQTSAEGFELRFAVNYLAGFLLTLLLLPLIQNSAPARIVNVSSAGQQPIDFGDVMLTRGYSGARAYCQSKLAQIMFTIDLGAALEDTGVTVTYLHPATYIDEEPGTDDTEERCPPPRSGNSSSSTSAGAAKPTSCGQINAP